MDMYLPILRHPAAFSYAKHFIQRVHQSRLNLLLGDGSVPFWRHANLSDEDLNQQCANMAAAEEDYEDKLPDDEEEEEFDNGVETRTFITSMQ